jgi:hypothetical protein
MTKLRGVEEFEKLWQRRNIILSDDGTEFHLMSLPDLVKAKKTQRDKDWPMIRRLVEADYFASQDRQTSEQVEFWLREMRTPELLIEIASARPEIADYVEAVRPLLKFASVGDEDSLIDALFDEEKEEREADRTYWRPLRAELEQLRRNRLDT